MTALLVFSSLSDLVDAGFASSLSVRAMTDAPSRTRLIQVAERFGMDGTVSLNGESETLLLLRKLESRFSERKAMSAVSTQESTAERIARIVEHVDKSYPICNKDSNATNQAQKHWTDFLL
ncbi:hypothetical protein F5883DRAFT_182845 [Diaporthe sp. PMI_573]|nr:hypothetical protein F5883DRAFT_182845 [Diaporthaceae sp. PMI_573]